MTKFVIQLGSQVQYKNHGKYSLPLHTEMRTEASYFALKRSETLHIENLIISGGSNFGVRYNDTEIIPADFSFSALARANFSRKSEAEVIKRVLVDSYGIKADRIFTETVSATTQENALFAAIILRRTPTFDGVSEVGILSNYWHVKNVLPLFESSFEKVAKMFDEEPIKVQPFIAEDILARYNPRAWIDKICGYYATPKRGVQYPVEEIRKLLSEQESLTNLE